MVLIRRLLLDAQTKFRIMVEDNKNLAARIDGSIHAANQEVTALRAELADTNKRLTEIDVTASNKKDIVTQTDGEYNGRQKIDEENELIQLRTENSRLEVQVRSLSREVEELSRRKAENSDHISYGEMKLDLIQHKQELSRAKEALQAMKADRKRLKAEKLELLNQLKQLYATLEEKEGELRDFIRKYEQRMRESDDSIKQLANEKDESEREKWEIIKRARDSAEISVLLRAQLDSKDQQIKKLETLVTDLRDQLTSQRHSYSLDLGDNPDSLDSTAPTSEDLPPYETPPPSASFNTKSSSFIVPTSTPKDSRERSDSLTPLIQMFDISQSNSIISSSPADSKKKKRISLGSLSKVFTRSRSRRSIAVPTGREVEECSLQNTRMTLLNPDNYQEKLQVLDQSKGSHMSTWKANQVLAWLEIVLSMPSYGKMCAENIKSGKVLLGLSDSELSSALNITNPIHRRKLRLAIEEQRNPADMKYPKCSNVDHTWVAHRWVPDLGLAQYTNDFESHLVDGRILTILSKRDLEKHFSIHRKFHQASISHGIELLRRLGFDKEVLMDRRTKSEETDGDLLVWTNQRVIKWVRSVDLEEYADNLRDSGVHGALMVLEPSFTADTLATALGIPPSKSYIRRHLAAEMDTLVKTARASLDLCNGGTQSQSRQLNRSYRMKTDHETSSKSRLSFRGSLGRAFGRKIRDDLKLAFDVEMPKKKQISSPIPILQSTSSSSVIQSAEKTT